MTLLVGTRALLVIPQRHDRVLRFRFLAVAWPDDAVYQTAGCAERLEIHPFYSRRHPQSIMF